MRLAREGIPTIGTLLAVTAVGYVIYPAVSAALLFPLALCVWFYRDPDRTPPLDSDGWVSPADGRVVEVTDDSLDQYAGRTTKIGIFMNGLDVHVNRFPTDGEVEEIRYVPGKKWFAIEPKASEANERMYVGIMTSKGRTTLVQVAGIMARRIVCKINMGETLARGERYGMIKLGSRVDIYLPNGVTPAVKPGDRVRAGESIIGVISG
ncbi:MAG: phosphatidylserine decarboxylase [Synergistaceae bacterium]|jgi:phosphatidylserine decarboxylase|nr:phosphatidylserine decarboxylase [Synergistaceae bacterium]